MRSLVVASFFVAGSLMTATAPAAAAGTPTPAQDASIKLNYPAPPVQGGRTVETDIAPPPTPSSPAPVKQVASQPPAMQMPTIAAAGQPPDVAASAASGAASTPATGLQPGVVPGQPMRTYATMADAAKAGIDPLNEAERKPVAAPAPSPVVAAGFNWLDPQSYRQWLDAHRQVVFKYAAMVLVAALAGWLYSRRKGKGE